MIKYLAPILTFCLMLASARSAAQRKEADDSLHTEFRTEQEALNRSFSEYFYGKYTQIYSLNEREFISTLDSSRKDFTEQLRLFEKDHPAFNKTLVRRESSEIKYSFDKFLLDYPYYHERFTEKKCPPNGLVDQRLKGNIEEFNSPELLQVESFKSYLKSFLYFRSIVELRDPAYKRLDNQQLHAILNLIPEYFSNRSVVDYLNYDYLYRHIDNFGITNLETSYHHFITTCSDSSYVNKIKESYAREAAGRKGHVMTTYKTVDGFNLEMHLFLPENVDRNRRRPAIVYFSGGSWSEGKPDWNFSACQSFAEKGWVGAAVAYRLADRHGTLPFEAVMDARSAIRWLRQHADEYHIDTSRIVASGNSAGGHLVLAAALADKWNEKTDDLRYSPVPNVLMVTSGVFDLTDDNTGWIRQGLRDRNLDEKLVEEISPGFLIGEGLPPTLIIHGTNDRNVPFVTAEQFVTKMTQKGNRIEFHPIEGAGHFIWYGRYGSQVSELRRAFLEKLGYRQE